MEKYNDEHFDEARDMKKIITGTGGNPTLPSVKYRKAPMTIKGVDELLRENQEKYFPDTTHSSQVARESLKKNQCLFFECKARVSDNYSICKKHRHANLLWKESDVIATQQEGYEEGTGMLIGATLIVILSLVIIFGTSYLMNLPSLNP